jgi:hypothetical protein
MDQTVRTNRSGKVILNINSLRLIFFGDSVLTFFFPWINRRLRGTFGARAVFTKFIGGGVNFSCHGGETSAATTRSFLKRSFGPPQFLSFSAGSQV